MAHTPKEVIAKNFQDDIEDWDQIPGRDLYIFPGGTHRCSHPKIHELNILHIVALPSDQKPPEDPFGTIPQPFSYEFSKVEPTRYPGGSVKIADSTTFSIAKEIAVAEVTVEPGAMRALHVRLIVLIPRTYIALNCTVL